MTIAIEQSLSVSAFASHASPASSRTRPIRVVTNAGPQARNKLLKLGFVVQVLDDHNSELVATEVDIIVVDSCLTLSTVDAIARLHARGIGAPVVLINGLASPEAQADDGADTPAGGSSTMGALALATAFADGGRAIATDDALTCGRLSLQSGRVVWSGVEVYLTVGEFRVVGLLAGRPGQYSTYREIYDCIRYEGFIAGEGSQGYCSNVRTTIKRIRDKFRAVDPSFDAIENFAKFGYRWRNPD